MERGKYLMTGNNPLLTVESHIKSRSLAFLDKRFSVELLCWSNSCNNWDFVLAFLLQNLHVLRHQKFFFQITGGSQGIGLELAKQCAAKGSDVTLLARKVVSINLSREGMQH